MSHRVPPIMCAFLCHFKSKSTAVYVKVAADQVPIAADQVPIAAFYLKRWKSIVLSLVADEDT